ncbi:MAG: SDR family oxidoreductase, partial [Actinobacteria bacterium]
EAMSPEGVKTHMDVTREMTDTDWDLMLKVHLYGTFHCTREALRLMEDGGSIVNMSSVVGLQGTPGIPHYAAAKAGILGFTRSVAQEVGSRGVRVNAICPGYIDTPMTQIIPDLLKQLVVARTPLGRMGTPEDIARTALFLASDDSSFITGQWISTNGGLVVQ